MKKKIGIVTLFGCYNFGNRLQNYAVQKLFENRGYSVETLVCEKSRIRLFLRYFKFFINGLCGDGDGKRRIAFRRFNKKKIPVRYFFEKDMRIKSRVAAEYDFFVTGGDQVWNPGITPEKRQNYFLSFAHRAQRICVAPSIGADHIGDEHAALYKKGLCGFPYLSCREDIGARAITHVSGRECEHIIDPTLALSADKWCAFETDCAVKEKYVVMFFLGDVADGLRRNITEYAQQNGYVIIDPSDPKSKYYSVTPDKFVSLINNAQLVFTDSFHVTAFSINLNTPFYVYDRFEKKSELSSKMNSRIKSLVSLLCQESRYVDYDFSDFIIECDFEKTNQSLLLQRQKCSSYIDKCLSQKELPFLSLPDKACSGCGVCSLSCPTGCISMCENAEGFLTPAVSYTECITCGKCIKACPALSTDKKETGEIEIYAAYQKDEQALNGSTSGAVFPLLAEWTVGRGGVVCGAAFGDGFSVSHSFAETVEDCKKFYTSKYVQSRSFDCFEKIKAFLDEGREVLFCSTPCQVEALRHYLQKDYENLLLADFVCHGVPSPAVWREYLDYIKQTELGGADITSVNFREKTPSWENYSLKIASDSDTYIASRNDDAYLKAFSVNLTLRESCFDCHFKGAYRCSDITIADFWGIQGVAPDMKNPDGTSMVILHSKKGRAVFEEIKPKLVSRAVSPKDVVGVCNVCLTESVKPSKNRDKFFAGQGAGDIRQRLLSLCTYQKPSFIKRVKSKLKRIFKKLF